MENKPIVSVILPHYNHKEQLFEAVQSVIDQTFKSWELILINDDPNYDILHYTYLDNRIKVYQDNSHLGQAARLNEGIAQAQGEYIAFADADDISLPHRFEISVSFLKQNYDVIVGHQITIDRKGRYFYHQPNTPICLETIKKGVTIGAFASIMVRAVLAKQIIFPEDIGYGNDRFFWIDLLKLTQRVKIIPLPIYYFRNYTSNFRVRYTGNYLTALYGRFKLRQMKKKLYGQAKKEFI